MTNFEDIKAGARLRGLDSAGVAEVEQTTHFGSDAINLVFRVNGRVGERLVYRGEETASRCLRRVGPTALTPTAIFFVWQLRRIGSALPTYLTLTGDKRFPEAFILAVVRVAAGFAHRPVYVRRFFQRELGFAETAVAFVDDLLSLGQEPA
jgi:hypothetical protein